MKNYLSVILGAIDDLKSKSFDKDEQHKADLNDNKLIQSVRAAREEWMSALNYFEQVSDPDLIDYAIYKIEASRRKYMYLLKQARIDGVEDKQIKNQLSEASMS